jgi:hypothetical protein
MSLECSIVIILFSLHLYLIKSMLNINLYKIFYAYDLSKCLINK